MAEVQTYLPADTRQRIQDILKERKISQAKLAESIGISESAFSRYLQGKTEMLGDGYIIRIAKFLNVSTDFILGETNIPDRKNYDIEELGLTAEAVQALYTDKVNTEVVSQLLGNPKFATLTNLLAQYQKEVFITGMSAMNQNLDFLRSLMLSQAKVCQEDKAAANAVAADLQSMKLPPVSVDTAAIQNLFNQILRELRANAESHLEESKLATKETLEKLRRELSKGQESVDLKSLTPEDIAAAVTKVVPEGAFPEEKLQNLGSALTELLTAAADTDHNE